MLVFSVLFGIDILLTSFGCFYFVLFMFEVFFVSFFFLFLSLLLGLNFSFPFPLFFSFLFFFSFDLSVGFDDLRKYFGCLVFLVFLFC